MRKSFSSCSKAASDPPERQALWLAGDWLGDLHQCQGIRSSILAGNLSQFCVSDYVADSQKKGWGIAEGANLAYGMHMTIGETTMQAIRLMNDSLSHGLLLGTVLCYLFLSPVEISARDAAGQQVTHVFRLRHKADGFFLSSRRISPKLGRKALAREPDWGDHETMRGALLMGPGASDDIPFVWDHSAEKLYLDLNRNGDLTDDPVFENHGEKSKDEFEHEFKGIVLTSSRGPQYGLWTVDITLQGVESAILWGGITVRSGWEAEILLRGRKMLLSVLDDTDGAIGDTDAVVLRELGMTFHEMYVIGTTPPFSKPPKQLFYEGCLYQLAFQIEPEEDGGVVVARLTEMRTSLGECEITGQHITRLVLWGGDEMAAVMERPHGRVSIPAAWYWEQQAFLDGGTSIGVFSGSCRKDPRVSKDSMVSFQIGGPLHNTIAVEHDRWSHDLRLQYTLVGAGGETYNIPRRDPDRMPRFVVYRNNREIGSGSFEESYETHSPLEFGWRGTCSWRIPLTVFGDLKIVASMDLGDLGPREGNPVVYHWPLTRNLPAIAPLVFVLVLLLLPANRSARAWMALVPVVVLGCAFFLATRIPPGNTERLWEPFLVLQSLAISLCCLWLVAHHLGEHRRLVAWLLAEVFLVAVTILSFFCLLGFSTEFTRMMFLAMVSVDALVVAMALALGGVCCRKHYGPWRYTGWISLWMLILNWFLVNVMSFFLGLGLPVSWEEILSMSRIAGISTFVSLVILGPFLILAFRNRLYHERFQAIFRFAETIEKSSGADRRHEAAAK